MRHSILRLSVLALVLGACGGGDDDTPTVPDEDTTPSRVAFYDWEANVIGPDGRPRPDDPAVTGGSAAGAAVAGITRAQARRRAKDGMVVVRAENGRDRWYVLRDEPALTGQDIVDPEQAFDQSPGGTNAPIVTFDFTDRGRAAFHELTRTLARRGQRARVPGGGDVLESAQHFAVVVDGEIVSTPYIDYEQNPDGIDATGSRIEGGLTIERAQEIVAILKAGPLPAQPEAGGEEPGG